MNFFRTTACTAIKLIANVPLGVLKKSCIFLKSLYLIRNPRWLPSDCPRYFFDFFSRTTACEVSRCARNVPLEVLKKCCCFSEWFKIQHGHRCLWLVETFLTSFPEKTACYVTRQSRYVSSGGSMEKTSFQLFHYIHLYDKL